MNTIPALLDVCQVERVSLFAGRLSLNGSRRKTPGRGDYCLPVLLVAAASGLFLFFLLASVRAVVPVENVLPPVQAKPVAVYVLIFAGLVIQAPFRHFMHPPRPKQIAAWHRRRFSWRPFWRRRRRQTSRPPPRYDTSPSRQDCRFRRVPG